MLTQLPPKLCFANLFTFCFSSTAKILNLEKEQKPFAKAYTTRPSYFKSLKLEGSKGVILPDIARK